MKPTIFYVEKDSIYPAFGLAELKTNRIYIRKDLPTSVQKFVEDHELYHLTDDAKFWLWREIKANLAGALKHPWGFVVCSVMSLAPYRLKLYWDRIMKGY